MTYLKGDTAATGVQRGPQGDPGEVTTAEMDTAIAAAIVGLAPLASPTFTGNVVVPNQSDGNNSTKAANTAFVTNAIGDAVVGFATTGDLDTALDSVQRLGL